MFHKQIVTLVENALLQAIGQVETVFYRNTAQAGFAVREVLVVNRRETPMEQIAERLGVGIGDPILALDLQQIRSELESLGWVKSADIERRLPDRIVLHLTERQPVAIRRSGGKSELVDIDGVVIGPHDPNRFTGLKTIRGKGAAAQTAALLRLLQAAPEFQQLVSDAVWVGDRRWDLHLQQGVVVRLPEHDAARIWKALTGLIREQRLLDRDIGVIDARLPERITVESAAPPAPRRSVNEQHA